MYFAQCLVLGKASKNVSKTKTYVPFYQKTQREENVSAKAKRGRLLQKHVCGRALQQPEKQNKKEHSLRPLCQACICLLNILMREKCLTVRFHQGQNHFSGFQRIQQRSFKKQICLENPKSGNYCSYVMGSLLHPRFFKEWAVMSL